MGASELLADSSMSRPWVTQECENATSEWVVASLPNPSVKPRSAALFKVSSQPPRHQLVPSHPNASATRSLPSDNTSSQAASLPTRKTPVSRVNSVQSPPCLGIGCATHNNISTSGSMSSIEHQMPRRPACRREKDMRRQGSVTAGEATVWDMKRRACWRLAWMMGVGEMGTRWCPGCGGGGDRGRVEMSGLGWWWHGQLLGSWYPTCA
ncbi:hypothetical protein QBC39DRAFT_150285 [Podospora conica]|nr:hypothetical protein QBC39DRAFT_150285 [Schizothecium conicum]